MKELTSTKVYIVGENSTDPIRVEFPHDATINDVKKAAIEHGLATETDLEKLEAFAEEIDESYPGNHLIKDLPWKQKRRRFFCGRCSKLVKVTIHFECKSVHSKFWAGARVQRVLDWALKELGLTGSDADDLVLRFGKDDSAPVDTDLLLGSLVTRRGGCELEFYLTPEVLVNG